MDEISKKDTQMANGTSSLLESFTDHSPCIDDIADFTERFYGLPVIVLLKVTVRLPENYLER